MSKIKVVLVLALLLFMTGLIWAESPLVTAYPTKLKGYVRTRYLVLPQEADTFRFDELSLDLRTDFTDKMWGEVGVLAYGGNTYLFEHMYLGIKGLPLNGTLLIGQTRDYAFGLVPTGANRVTTNYGIVSDMFTHDRILGVQYIGKLDVIDFSLAVHNGYALGSRQAGEGKNKVNFLADRDSTLGTFQGRDASDNKEMACRIGNSTIVPGLSFGASGSSGELSDADLAFLVANATSTEHTTYITRQKTRIGVDAKYIYKQLQVQAEAYEGKSSELRHTAWQALVLYKFPYDTDKTFNVYARYGEVIPDVTATAKSYTWKLKQTVAGCVYYFTKALWLQTEGEVNDENPPAGVDKVKNNVIFTELFVGF